MNISDLELFVRTADSSSISRAAEQLSITTATASAALKRLEKQLETQLFIRSTRQIRITAEGERFLVYCREALNNLNDGRASIHALQGKIAGELRISAPSDLGRNILLRWVDEILSMHSELAINLAVGDSLADFYLDRVDIAIRYGKLSDSSMVAFKLASVEGALCASPKYLESFGTPKTPEDLTEHNCLLFQRDNRLHDLWDFGFSNHANTERFKVRVTGNRSSNDSDIVRLWAISGHGIAQKSRLDMAADIQAGRLVRILPEYNLASLDLNMLCPSRRQVTPAVLLLRDVLREKVAKALI